MMPGPVGQLTVVDAPLVVAHRKLMRYDPPGSFRRNCRSVG
jgi:hypothetical protein